MHIVCLATLLLIRQDGDTCLMWAAWKGHVDVVRLLVELKADIDASRKVNIG